LPPQPARNNRSARIVIFIVFGTSDYKPELLIFERRSADWLPFTKTVFPVASWLDPTGDATSDSQQFLLPCEHPDDGGLAEFWQVDRAAVSHPGRTFW
jgi:hypothetical protein